MSAIRFPRPRHAIAALLCLAAANFLAGAGNVVEFLEESEKRAPERTSCIGHMKTRSPGMLLSGMRSRLTTSMTCEVGGTPSRSSSRSDASGLPRAREAMARAYFLPARYRPSPA